MAKRQLNIDRYFKTSRGRKVRWLNNEFFSTHLDSRHLGTDVSVRAAAVKGLEVEEQILRILGKHPRIIQLEGKHEDGLLLEYLPKGSIERYLRSNAPCTTVAQRLRWGQQTTEGLACIHEKNILHCDVSVGNLLLDTDLSIKLIAISRAGFLHTSGNVTLDGGAAESVMSSMPRPNGNY
jgi:serine/threonine protein kinase